MQAYNKMLREHSPRAYYVRNFLLNIMRESKKQKTVFFLSHSKIAYKFLAYYFSTTVSLAVKAVHESV